MIFPHKESPLLTLSTSKEKPLKGHNIAYLKPGMGTGGSTMAGINLMNQLAKLGANVTLTTGYIGADINNLIPGTIERNVDPKMDPYVEKNPVELIKTWTSKIKTLENISPTIILYFSFMFVPQELSDFIADLSQEVNLIIPMFDPPQHIDAFARLSSQTLILPGTNSLKKYLQQLLPNTRYKVLPPFFDSDLVARVRDKGKIREELKTDNQSILLVQPTRVDFNKGIDRAVILASSIGKKTGRMTELVVTGGYGNNRSEKIKRELEVLATSLGVRISFLGNIDNPYDIMSAADIVTFLSSIEGFGMPPAEAAYLGKPVVTSSYVNQLNNPIFNEIYGDFEFVVDDSGSGNISENTTAQVYEYLSQPEIWTPRLTSNKNKALRYSGDSLNSTLKEIFTINQ